MTTNISYTLSYSGYTTAFADEMDGESGVDQNGDATHASAALQAWKNVADINFTSAGSPTIADLVIAEGTLNPRYFGDTIYGRSVQYLDGAVNKRGVIVSKTNVFDATHTEAYTYLHEIGHTLIGPDHIIASRTLSIMADGTASYDGDKPLPTAPMILDIQAVQATFGANYTYKSGNDTYGDGSAKTWTIWDGNGTDTITAVGQSTMAVIDLRGGLNAAGTDACWSHIGSEWISIAYDAGHFTGVVPIEIALGGSAGDSIYGGGISNPELRGNGGNDTIWGDGDKGAGMSFGGDTIYGDAGNDTLYGDSGQNTLAGDTVTAGGADVIYGGGNNDKIYGEGANDTLYGDAGLDTLYGGQGADSIMGGADADVIYGGLGGDRLYGDGGNDTIYAYDSINGENDTAVNYLYGGAGNDSLIGGAGIDIFDGGGGADTINGGAGNDTFTYTDGNAAMIDELHWNGGTGNDTFIIANLFTDNVAYFPSTDFARNLTIQDDDNVFSFDMNMSGYVWDYEYSAGSTKIDSYYIGGEPGNNFGHYAYMFSSGDDMGISMGSFSTRAGIDMHDIAIIFEGVGKDLNYGNDLLTYLINSGKIDLSGLSSGNIFFNIGSSVTGTSDNDIIRVNKAITSASGNGGADIFVADNQSYSGTVQDFSSAQGDKIDLTAFDGTLTSLAQLNATGSSNAVLTLTNGSTLTLNGVNASSLTASDFLSNTLYYGAGGTLAGDGGNNTIVGSVGDDLIFCEGGSDTANGGMGSDTIWGWEQADVLVGHYGHDYIGGDGGNDTISGGSGIDSLFGGDNNDSIRGGDHGDLISGDAGNDILFGDGGNDTIDGGTGNDTMNGDAGDDTYYVDSALDIVNENDSFSNGAANISVDTIISTVSYTLTYDAIENLTLLGTAQIDGTGNNNDNYITGNSGTNILRGGEFGNDTFDGGEGNDLVFGDDGSDNINGGDGSDTVSYYNSSVGVNVNLLSNTVAVGFAEGDSLTSIENIYGSNSAGAGDNLKGSDGDNVLRGYGGNDILAGNGGSDTIEGSAGADTINGGDGIDWISFVQSTSGVNVSLHANSGTYGDALGDVYSNIENFTGSNYDDNVLGSTGDNVILGAGGSDLLRGYLGNDTLTGGAGNDQFYFEAGHGTDVITDFAGNGSGAGDVIRLVGLTGLSTWANVLSATNDVGLNAVITTSGGTITLVGVAKSSLDASDFQFS